jgi:hypothetical protein
MNRFASVCVHCVIDSLKAAIILNIKYPLIVESMSTVIPLYLN